MNPTQLLIDDLVHRLERGYDATFGEAGPEYRDALSATARAALGCIANSDALYHDVIHTVLVSLVGQEILRGRHLESPVTPSDWTHLLAACLLHDVGFVRGGCSGDSRESYVVDAAGERVTPPRGASDAYLAPWHVDRSQLFTKELFGTGSVLDPERVARAIENTRFPVPSAPAYQDTASEPGLVRAADLIGQLGDPHYLRKLTHLYHEFDEIGKARQFGYQSAADLVDAYPRFFRELVEPYLVDGIRYLRMTPEGERWVESLYGHVATLERGDAHAGPQRTSAGVRPISGAATRKRVRGGT